MERLTNPSSFCHDVLATTGGVDGQRGLRGNLAAGAAQTGSEGTRGLERGDGGCDIYPGKKGDECVGPTKWGPVLPYAGSKLMLLIDGKGLPLGIDLHSASPAELRLIEMLLDQHVLDPHAPRLIHDRAADSDSLRDRLADDGIQLICPHRKGRRYRHAAQDGRVLKRYRQRRKVERTIAWLGNDRRLLTRFQRCPRLLIAFAQHSANNCSCPFDINERAKVASGRWLTYKIKHLLRRHNLQWGLPTKTFPT